MVPDNIIAQAKVIEVLDELVQPLKGLLEVLERNRATSCFLPHVLDILLLGNYSGRLIFVSVDLRTAEGSILGSLHIVLSRIGVSGKRPLHDFPVDIIIIIFIDWDNFFTFEGFICNMSVSKQDLFPNFFESLESPIDGHTAVVGLGALLLRVEGSILDKLNLMN